MKRGIILSAFLVAVMVATGFTYGQSNTKETRDLKGFTRVSYGVSGNLYINVGPEFKVVLEGDKSLLDEIITEVADRKLVIRKDNWKLHFYDRINVYITMPELNGLGVSGSGKAEIKDALKAEDLDLTVSGSGRILTADVEAANLNCDISGSGNISLEGNGSITKAGISISGSGGYMGETAKIGTLDIDISGSGNCSCNVTESLRASVSGSGNVTYLGNPKIDARVAGSGRVRSK
jgi:hypothetical protein